MIIDLQFVPASTWQNENYSSWKDMRDAMYTRAKVLQSQRAIYTFVSFAVDID